MPGEEFAGQQQLLQRCEDLLSTARTNGAQARGGHSTLLCRPRLLPRTASALQRRLRRPVEIRRRRTPFEIRRRRRPVEISAVRTMSSRSFPEVPLGLITQRAQFGCLLAGEHLFRRRFCLIYNRLDPRHAFLPQRFELLVPFIDQRTELFFLGCAEMQFPVKTLQYRLLRRRRRSRWEAAKSAVMHEHMPTNTAEDCA